MKKYEILFAVPNKYTKEEVAQITEGVHKLLTEFQCEIEHSENFGKRKLAYPIKNFFHAYYILTLFHARPEVITQINEKLNLNNDILRHMIVEPVETGVDKIITLKQEFSAIQTIDDGEDKKTTPKITQKETSTTMDGEKDKDKKAPPDRDSKKGVKNTSISPTRTEINPKQKNFPPDTTEKTASPESKKESIPIDATANQKQEESKKPSPAPFKEEKTATEDSALDSDQSERIFDPQKEKTKTAKKKKSLEDLGDELEKLLEDDLII